VIPGVPSDNTTLLEVLDELAQAGFAATMWVAADGKLRCEGCNHELDPSAVRVHQFRRLEGASDPDDMLVVAAVECPQCGTKASIVLHFGPESSPEEMEVLTHLQRAAPR
jgi:hypothetical protein